MPVYELTRTKAGTRTLVAKGRAVTLTHEKPLKVFLNAAQTIAFSNTANVDVRAVEDPPVVTKATKRDSSEGVASRRSNKKARE